MNKTTYYIKPKCFVPLLSPRITHNGRCLMYISEHKYLGCFVTDDLKNNLDIFGKIRYMYSMGNSVAWNFKHCTYELKIQLYRQCNI